MTMLKDLLIEGTTTNRISLTRIEAIMETIAPKLSATDQKKLAEAYVELKGLSDSLNVTPYNIFNHDHWKLLNMILMGKVAQFKLVVEDIAEDNKEIDFAPLANAIELILTY